MLISWEPRKEPDPAHTVAPVYRTAEELVRAAGDPFPEDGTLGEDSFSCTFLRLELDESLEPGLALSSLEWEMLRGTPDPGLENALAKQYRVSRDLFRFVRRYYLGWLSERPRTPPKNSPIRTMKAAYAVLKKRLGIEHSIEKLNRWAADHRAHPSVAQHACERRAEGSAEESKKKGTKNLQYRWESEEALIAWYEALIALVVPEHAQTNGIAHADAAPGPGPGPGGRQPPPDVSGS